MELSLKDKVKLRKESKKPETVEISGCTRYTSTEIMDVYLPKTKTSEWYKKNCIGEGGNLPLCAVNGHPGGKPFKTADSKIMRSGATTWDDLGIKPC